MFPRDDISQYPVKLPEPITPIANPNHPPQVHVTFATMYGVTMIACIVKNLWVLAVRLQDLRLNFDIHEIQFLWYSISKCLQSDLPFFLLNCHRS